MRRLRAKRNAAGLTQAAVALRLKQTPSFVHKCEVGERQLNVWELYQWCQALEVPWLEMMQELGEIWQRPAEADADEPLSKSRPRKRPGLAKEQVRGEDQTASTQKTM